MTPMAALAVTGDVGAGKSAAARLMEDMGAARFDADVIAGEMWRRPDVLRAALSRWGPGILDPEGRVAHRAVAARIFTDRAEYQWCCALLHPLVMEDLERRVLALPRDRWAVAEIPLLFEAGRPWWVAAAVFVTAPRDVRLARCRQRGWDEAELERREGFFLPSGERMARSDFVLRNDGNLEALKAGILRIVRSEQLRIRN